nr:pollen-specific leucine-rich repeat extensin-like protein 1 [Penaeus vannamei]
MNSSGIYVSEDTNAFRAWFIVTGRDFTTIVTPANSSRLLSHLHSTSPPHSTILRGTPKALAPPTPLHATSTILSTKAPPDRSLQQCLSPKALALPLHSQPSLALHSTPTAPSTILRTPKAPSTPLHSSRHRLHNPEPRPKGPVHSTSNSTPPSTILSTPKLHLHADRSHNPEHSPKALALPLHAPTATSHNPASTPPRSTILSLRRLALHSTPPRTAFHSTPPPPSFNPEHKALTPPTPPPPSFNPGAQGPSTLHSTSTHKALSTSTTTHLTVLQSLSTRPSALHLRLPPPPSFIPDAQRPSTPTPTPLHRPQSLSTTKALALHFTPTSTVLQILSNKALALHSTLHLPPLHSHFHLHPFLSILSTKAPSTPTPLQPPPSLTILSTGLSTPTPLQPHRPFNLSTRP